MADLEACSVTGGTGAGREGSPSSCQPECQLEVQLSQVVQTYEPESQASDWAGSGSGPKQQSCGPGETSESSL